MARSEGGGCVGAGAAGRAGVETAVETLAAGPMNGSVDLGFARVDTHRGLRTGDPEVVFAAGKSADQTVAILTELARQDGGRPALANRLPDDALAAVDRERLQLHLADCPHCSEYLAQLRITVDALGRMDVDQLSDEAVDELIAVYRRWAAG